MNYSTDTSTATTTPRLRTLQSSSSSSNYTNVNVNNTNITTNNNNNIENNLPNPKSINNFILIAKTAFVSPSTISSNQNSKSLSNNINNNNNSTIEHTIMMSSGGHRGGEGDRDRQTGIEEIEPLLSSSVSTSATISPMRETYNANNKIIVHDKKNQTNSSVNLVMESATNAEGDSIHFIEEESSSLLMSTSDHHRHHSKNYVVIRTGEISLKNVIFLNLLSFLFVSLNMILNLLVISIIHERIPMDQPHLPDIAFDVLPDHRHFLDIAEYVIIIQTFCVGLLLFFHKYRSTILRRICIIMGIIYFFRALCLASTQLPVASKNYYCSPQLKNLSGYENITSLQFIKIITSRVFYMSIGMGLSINGHHTFCGDYIFSGHTVILVLTFLIQQEYLLPSRKRTLVWKCINLIQITMTITSVICILIARGHYLIDIIIAYFVTTRVFWIYHTLCNFNAINLKSNFNHLNRVWWWPVFVYIENIRVISSSSQLSSSMSNHHDHRHSEHHHTKNDDIQSHHYSNQVQRIFEWPLPWPKRFVRRSKHHRSHH